MTNVTTVIKRLFCVAVLNNMPRYPYLHVQHIALKTIGIQIDQGDGKGDAAGLIKDKSTYLLSVIQ